MPDNEAGHFEVVFRCLLRLGIGGISALGADPCGIGRTVYDVVFSHTIAGVIHKCILQAEAVPVGEPIIRTVASIPAFADGIAHIVSLLRVFD